MGFEFGRGLFRIAAISIAFVLVGCGNGKVSSSISQSQESSILPSNTGGPLTGEEALDSEETAFLSLINTYRTQNGLAVLVISNTLTTAAAWMSSDMANGNYFSHTDSLGRSFGTRLATFSYSASFASENIAAGSSTAQATITQWKNSPGHNANMLNTNAKAIGIARAYSASSTYKWYWTTVFGSATY